MKRLRVLVLLDPDLMPPESRKGYSEVVYRQTVEDVIRFRSPTGAKYASPGRCPGIEWAILAEP